jgi:hypothetical protein
MKKFKLKNSFENPIKYLILNSIRTSTIDLHWNSIIDSVWDLIVVSAWYEIIDSLDFNLLNNSKQLQKIVKTEESENIIEKQL